MKIQELNRSVMDTPYGEMVAMATAKGLCVLEFVKPKRQELLTRRLNKWFSGYTISDISGPILEQTGQWLDDYFKREFERLSAPPLDLRGTGFELRVWHALLRIPLGETASYGQVAMELGIPKAARAVGGANRRNPVSLIVPCHRVIGRNDSLVGYGGGLDVKKALLMHERKM